MGEKDVHDWQRFNKELHLHDNADATSMSNTQDGTVALHTL